MLTAQHDQAVERARETLSRMKALTARSAPACVNCRWFHNAEPLLDWPSDRQCRHPVVAAPSFDPADGEIDFYAIPIASVRSEGGLCKPEGLLFERGYLGFWNGAHPLAKIFGSIATLMIVFATLLLLFV